MIMLSLHSAEGLLTKTRRIIARRQQRAGNNAQTKSRRQMRDDKFNAEMHGALKSVQQVKSHIHNKNVKLFRNGIQKDKSLALYTSCCVS